VERARIAILLHGWSIRSGFGVIQKDPDLKGWTTLIDAIVYKTGNDVDGVGLDTALGVTGGVVDEWGRDGTATTGALDSIGRIPNGAGSAQSAASWIYMTPTPNAVNSPPVPEPATVGLVLLGSLLVGLRRH